MSADNPKIKTENQTFGEFNEDQQKQQYNVNNMKQENEEAYSEENGSDQTGIDAPKYVRLRGLPWSATHQEILDFLKGINVINGSKGIHLITGRWDGKNTGEAYVEVGSQQDVEEARKLNKASMGHRYIEVFTTSSKEAREAMRKTGNHGGSYVVKLRGLPFAVSDQQIEEFFTGLEIKPDREGILFVMDRRGRATGEAFVQFETQEDTEQALGRNREKIGHRYIEIFRSSLAELKRSSSGSGRSAPYDIRDRGSNRGGFNDFPNGGRGGNMREGWSCNNSGANNTLGFNNLPNFTNSGNFGNSFGQNNGNGPNNGGNFVGNNSSQIANNDNFGNFGNFGNNGNFGHGGNNNTNNNNGPNNQGNFNNMGNLVGNGGNNNNSSNFAGNNRLNNGNSNFGSDFGDFNNFGNQRNFSGNNFGNGNSGMNDFNGNRNSGNNCNYGNFGNDGPGPNNGNFNNNAPSGGNFGPIGGGRGDCDLFTIHMRGLPYSSFENDVFKFFDPIRPVHVRINFNKKGLHSGSADAFFETYEDAQLAMKRHREQMGSRYIELFFDGKTKGGSGNSMPFGNNNNNNNMGNNNSGNFSRRI